LHNQLSARRIGQAKQITTGGVGLLKPHQGRGEKGCIPICGTIKGTVTVLYMYGGFGKDVIVNIDISDARNEHIIIQP